MKRLAMSITLSLFFFGFGFCQTSSSTTPPATKDPTAVALAQKALAAMGASVSTYQDSVVTGTLTTHADYGGGTLGIVIKSKGLWNVRSEIKRAAGTDVYVTDGPKGCLTRATGETQPTAFSNTYAEPIHHIPALSILADYSDSNVNVQYAGTGAVNGQLTDVIAISAAAAAAPAGFDSLAATQNVFYIARDSGLVIKAQYKHFSDNDSDGALKHEVYFSDYRNVGGLMVPFRVDTYVAGRLSTAMTLTSAALNVGLSSTDFAVTCGVANAN
jgi:hypothetical protein